MSYERKHSGNRRMAVSTAVAAVLCTAALSACSGSNPDQDASGNVVTEGSFALLHKAIQERNGGQVSAVILEPSIDRAFGRYADDTSGAHCIEFLDSALTRDEPCEEGDSEIPFTLASDLDIQALALIPAVKSEIGSPLLSRIVLLRQSFEADSNLTAKFFQVDPANTETDLNKTGNECVFLKPRMAKITLDGTVVSNSSASSVSYRLPASGNCDYTGRIFPE